MKKLLFAIVGAAAFSAFAADPDPSQDWRQGDIDVLGFENFDLTNPNVTGAVINRDDTGVTGTSKWSCSGDDASTVKTYGSENAAAPTGISFPAPFEDEGANYLALDTNGSELQRAIPNGGTSVAADGTYIDTLIQFTPSESAPTDLAGAKIAIWLGVENNVTNLCVAGDYYWDQAGTPQAGSNKIYRLSGTYEPATWYRLTIEARDISNAPEAVHLPGFIIRIDGEVLAASEGVYDSTLSSVLASFTAAADKTLLDENKFIPAMNADFSAAATIEAVGFKGTGALDDFVVTTVAPEFTPAGGDDYKVVIGGADVVVTPSAEDLAAVQAAVIAGGGTLDVTDVDAVNAALAAPIGTTGIPSWQALFLGLPPTEAGLESFKIDSISFDEDGNVVVELPDTVDPKTGRGVDITIKLKSADTPNAVDWTDVESASGTTFAPFAPGSTDTKKFYKVVVEFAGSSAQN